MQGLVHVYCGDGKGKTTAALGLGLRACGCGKKVLMAQFLKGNTSGELAALKSLERFKIMPSPDFIKFTFQMTPEELEDAARLCASQLDAAVAEAAGGDYDLLILDEVFGAAECGLLPEIRILDTIKNKPQKLELVLTGRNPKPEVLELADYISEIKKIRHPYDRNIPARRGIEF